MKFSQTQKLIFALVLLAVAGFVIYKFVLNGSSPSVASTGGVAVVNTADISVEGQNIVDMASKISSISIDSNFFTSPLFMGLVNFDVSPAQEAQGRPNPFADIGSDVGAQTIANASSSATTKPAK